MLPTRTPSSTWPWVNFYEWAHGEDLTEDGSREYQALVSERVQDFVNALRVAYLKYEEED